MTQDPLVSIGLPVRNGEGFITSALTSLLSQSHSHIELLISDNDSTDGTRDICLEWEAKDDRVRYHRLDKDVGAIPNFNRALSMASGEYFMWAAHDDLWEPTFVSTLLNLIESDPKSVLAFCAFDNIDATDAPLRNYEKVHELPDANKIRRLGNFISQEEQCGKANLIYGLMPRDLLVRVGGFQAWGAGTWGADMLMVFRLLSFGNLALTKELLFHKRLVATNKEAAGPLSTGVHMARDLAATWGYFTGYSRILRQDDEVASHEKQMLIKLVKERRRAFYRTSAARLANRTRTYRGKDDS